MQAIKTVANDLALIGHPLTEDEIVHHVLRGLTSEFKEISAGIRARSEAISFEELYEKLSDHEMFLKLDDARKDSHQFTAQYSQRSSSNNSGRRYNNSWHNRNPHNQNNNSRPQSPNNFQPFKGSGGNFQGTSFSLTESVLNRWYLDSPTSTPPSHPQTSGILGACPSSLESPITHLKSPPSSRPRPYVSKTQGLTRSFLSRPSPSSNSRDSAHHPSTSLTPTRASASPLPDPSMTASSDQVTIPIPVSSPSSSFTSSTLHSLSP
ncbi:hypothetical protein Patl1_26524 [Pistacia atlantica]|uniref:Uncharacterized protein n=1 Tax=Pistacia atlantica TaxID=434234 RepID=A0ACC1B3Z6_9ROSI|nr:hypothetical protein Patl1_26524 [Pistacia atlantica]